MEAKILVLPKKWKYDAAIKTIGAPIVPVRKAEAGERLENTLTIIIPTIEAIRPIDARANGKNIISDFPVPTEKVPAMAIQAIIDPQ